MAHVVDLQKGQVENLTDEELRKTLTAIAGVCEKGLANSYASSEVARAKWANVQKMCQVSPTRVIYARIDGSSTLRRFRICCLQLSSKRYTLPGLCRRPSQPLIHYKAYLPRFQNQSLLLQRFKLYLAEETIQADDLHRYWLGHRRHPYQAHPYFRTRLYPR